MNFKKAYELMKSGARIKCPEWIGFWYWDEKLETIIISTKTGQEFDIRDTTQVDYTFSFIVREDWETL